MLLILDDTKESKHELAHKHNMHALKGGCKGCLECYVANIGDWLLVWCVNDGFVSVFKNTELMTICKK